MNRNSINRRLTLAATCAFAAASAVPLSISWQVRRSLPEGIAGGVGAYLDHALIYAGGTTWRNGEKVWLASVHQYDVEHDTWSDGIALPEALAYGPSVVSSAGVEVLGGMTGNGPSLKCWRLQRGETAWRHVGDLPAASALARAARIAGRTYLFGGCPDVADLSGCSDSVLVRMGDGRWRNAGKLPSGPVALQASAVVGNRVYLFGGCAPAGPGAIRNLDQSWSFSPSQARWRKLRPLPVATRTLSATVLDRNRILLAGGYHAAQDEAKLHGPDYGFSNSVWIYHVDRDEYESVTALPKAVAGIEMVQAHGHLFAVGGEDKQRGRSPALFKLLIR